MKLELTLYIIIYVKGLIIVPKLECIFFSKDGMINPVAHSKEELTVQFANNQIHQSLHQCEQIVQQLVNQTQQANQNYQLLLQQEQQNAQRLEELAQREQRAVQTIQTALQGHQTAIQQLQQVSQLCRQMEQTIQSQFNASISQTNQNPYVNPSFNQQYQGQPVGSNTSYRSMQ